MPRLTFQCLWHPLPLVEVIITPSAYSQFLPSPAGGAARSPMERTLFLLDTGSSHCMVSQAILGPMQLAPHGSTTVGTATTDDPAGVTLPTCLVGLELCEQTPGRGRWPLPLVEITVAKSLAFPGPYHGLIGRDVLERAAFWYDPRNSAYSLTI